MAEFFSKKNAALGAAGETVEAVYNTAEKGLSKGDWKTGWWLYKTGKAEGFLNTAGKALGVGGEPVVFGEGKQKFEVDPDLNVPEICHSVQQKRISNLLEAAKKEASRTVGRAVGETVKRADVFSAIGEVAQSVAEFIAKPPPGSIVVDTKTARLRQDGQFAANAAAKNVDEFYVKQKDGTFKKVTKEQLHTKLQKFPTIHENSQTTNANANAIISIIEPLEDVDKRQLLQLAKASAAETAQTNITKLRPAEKAAHMISRLPSAAQQTQVAIQIQNQLSKSVPAAKPSPAAKSKIDSFLEYITPKAKKGGYTRRKRSIHRQKTRKFRH